MFDNTRIRFDLGQIQAHLTRVAIAPRGGDVVNPLRTSSRLAIPAGKLLWQALHNDCLRVAYVALAADERIVDEEIDATYDYLFSVARHYAEVLPAVYGPFAALEPESARDFLTRYAGDTGPFGFLAEQTQWAGLDACRRAAVIGDSEPLEHYTRLIGWLCDESLRIAGVDIADARMHARVAQISELRELLARRSVVPEPGTDLRVEAFLGGPRVFAAVTHAASVFEDDRFDVEEVHGEVRETFERLIAHAITPVKHGERGRMLLVLGDSGAGKTHLMRAFRSHVHEGALGFAVYAQLQSRSPEYGRYLLHNVIESLERRYGGPGDDASGLLELARGLPRLLGEPLQPLIARLADDDWSSPDALAAHVNQLVDQLLAHEDLSAFDPDLLRALMYLQCDDPRITPRVLKYLRCEPLNAHDRRWIGDVAPRTGADEPLWMIQQLARLAFVTQQAAFVLMVDQAELAGFDQGTIDTFKRAVDALYAVVSAVPSAIAVIACLKDMFTEAQAQLSKSLLDRLTMDPPQANLAMERTPSEISAIVARRLAWLYGDAGAVFRLEDPTYPIPATLLQKMTNLRTRSVLELCHHFQEACSAAGRVLEDWNAAVPPPPPPAPGTDDVDRLAIEWNEFLHDETIEIPDGDAGVLQLLAESAGAFADELGVAVAMRRTEPYVELDVGDGDAAQRLTLGVANQSPRGGWFGKQLEGLRSAGVGRTPVAVRTAPFPKGDASDAAVAKLLTAGGRKVLCPESDLRCLAALRMFADRRPGPVLDAWRRRDRPLLSRASFALMFAVEPVVAPPPPVMKPEPPGPKGPRGASRPKGPNGRKGPASKVPPAPPASGDLQVGMTMGLDQRPLELAPDELVRHSGVLGSPGSGKTTLALNLIEQLLERDVAVVLVDRKGDLAGYARPNWFASITDAAARKRAEALASRLDVRLFTPGNKGGRPLGFAVIPRLGGVPEHDRGRLVTHAATALAAMLRFGAGTRDRTRFAILSQAIALLAEKDAPAGLESLIDLIESRDDALVSRASKFDGRFFDQLVSELETLRLNEPELFNPRAEPLSAELLVGRSAGGRTPLSIVSTRFLGDTARVQSWTSQLFVELARWGMRSPAPRLQVLLMLDEADQYMPAVSRPPSKEPLMDLIKRSRSSGIGVMLATQTPGDLDYKSRDLITSWFIGKIGDTRSIDKVRQLLERKPALASKLGQLPAGQFVVANDTGVLEITRRPSLLRTDQLPEQEILTLARGHRP